MTDTAGNIQPDQNSAQQQVVVLMSDMVQYSQTTSAMSPQELKDFIIGYHHTLRRLIGSAENQPVDIEPSAGDGSLVVFKKNPGEQETDICSRALRAAIKVAYAIEEGLLPATRMGLFLGDIIEAQLDDRMAKFSTSFAITNRLEELCGHFGTRILMDRQVARFQKEEAPYLVSIGKFSLTSVLHPMNAYTVYKPGLHSCPEDLNEELLLRFIRMKNDAMELFSGNLLLGILPDFPSVRTRLIAAQKFFVDIAGKEDMAIARILEYIRETPFPDSDFNTRGMKLLEKKRDSLGDRLFHLSKQLLKAMNYDIYHTLVVDTQWEQFFKLEWHKKGSVIIQINEVPDGIYYLDFGSAKIVNRNGELLATMDAGAIFGEMAYFGDQHKRTATVIADSDVVVRKITTKDFRKLPVIIEIFRRIATARKKDFKRKPSR
jgi:class 3 adenylate cyclase